MSEKKEEEPPKAKPKPKEPEVSLEEKDSYRKRLNILRRHLDNVRSAGNVLADRLIDEGKLDLARRINQRVYDHDISKFEGIEWEWLTVEDKTNLLTAVHQHQQSNDHHPEYFTDGIKGMNDEQIAEMVCDWHARSTEMGTDLRVWINEKASARYGFSPRTLVGKKIKYFVDLLLDKPFS